MTTCNRGDIVLVKFVFAGDKSVKQRPGLILSTNAYHEARHEAVFVAITSRVRRLLPGNSLIRAWRESGLPAPSMAAGVIRTIKTDMVIRKLGVLPDEELGGVEIALRAVLGF